VDPTRRFIRGAAYGRAIGSQRNYNRLLKHGAGLFWNLAGDRVYLRGTVKVAARLTALAKAEKPALVATNIPGVREVYLRVGGDLGDFKAQVYAGWLAYREGPKIARDTLCKLFAVSRDTLRNWEQRLGASLEVIPTTARPRSTREKTTASLTSCPRTATTMSPAAARSASAGGSRTPIALTSSANIRTKASPEKPGQRQHV